MNQADIGAQIIKTAMEFINLYETKSNAAWANVADSSTPPEEGKEIHDAMLKTGWRDGLPYCMAFAETVWRLAYQEMGAPDAVINQFTKLLCPSVMTSYNAIKLAATKKPIPGSLFFMQSGGAATGHAGIVVSADSKSIATIEGNTSPGHAASTEADRNGDGIYKKVRTLDFTVKSKGLHLLGFYNPVVW